MTPKHSDTTHDANYIMTVWYRSNKEMVLEIETLVPIEETRELSRIINGDIYYGDSALASGLALMAQNKIERDEKTNRTN